MVMDFGRTNEIEDRLLSPVPIQYVALEKILNGVIQGTIAGLVVLPIGHLLMGPIPGLTFTHVGAILLVTLLGTAVFSAIGLLLGVVVEAQQIGFMFSLVIAPMLFFGCAYYPWIGLHVVPWLQYLVLINPLVYVSEGMRGALTPSIPHMSMFWSVGALTVLLVIILVIALNRFKRRAIA
jgi:ABC-2 type transport system permease protein